MERVGKPQFEFDYEPFDTGLYTFKVKEADVIPVKEQEEGAPARKGPKNDFNFVLQVVAEGGEMDGRLHFERFPRVAQGHIGLRKLQAILIKAEIMPPSSDADGYEVDFFSTEKFKTNFKMKSPGHKFIGIIKRRPSSTPGGGDFSNIVSFYHLNELAQAKADFDKKFKKVKGEVKGEVATPLPGAEVQQPAAKDAWD